jgi:hypothetical protein
MSSLKHHIVLDEMSSLKHHIVLDEMLISAKKRCIIPNANNGRAYMGCIILDRLRPLHIWLQQV